MGGYGHRGRYHPGEQLWQVPVEGDDFVVLHDDRPASWLPGGPTVLFLHGLLGCHLSPYVARCARKLSHRGFRTFRLDYRGCGAGIDVAKRPYHAGLSGDVAAALAEIHRLCPASPIGLVGYSMGGNLALKTLGEFAGDLPDVPMRAVAVNPAIDLAACCFQLRKPLQRMYDRFFAIGLSSRVMSRPDLFGEYAERFARRRPRRIVEFDRQFTVPVWGFRSAKEYYRQASAIAYIDHIRIPTLILHSRDDPLIPSQIFETLSGSGPVRVHLTDHGGHLGYFGRKGYDADRWWVDWRIIENLSELVSVTSPTDSAARAASQATLRY